MKRKVIKQANQAYTLTLPIDWVRKNNITKESEVDVQIKDKSLIVSSDSRIVGEKVKIEINENKDKNLGRNIGRRINALYARGVDEIEITSDKDLSSEILSSLNQNLGYALVKQTKNNFLVKDIGGGNYQNLDEIFKRVFQMILSFYESSMNDIFGKEKENMDSLNMRDREVNKFCLYLQRAINKMSYPDPIRGRTFFTYSFALEKIGDEIQRLWRTNIKYKIKKTKALKELMEAVNGGLSKSFEMHYLFNIKNMNEVYDIREDVRKKALALIKLDGYTARFVRHAVKIMEDAADLSHLVLMLKL